MSSAVVSFKPVVAEESLGTARDGQPLEKSKLGHRRIDEQGEVSYKRVPTNALMSAIQLGIANSIGSLASMPNRDLLLQDFEKIESVTFPAQGSAVTPSHSFGDFRFKTYAPIAFRYFRELFHIKPADFLRSICTEPLRELSNPGASGSIFYVSQDDQFIIKTVQHKEAEFLQKLLPGYYMNLNQNHRTLLPKFFGLFCYQSLGKNIRLLVMNNLLPQAITMHEKYDLKGSTYKRFASKSERSKAHPTLKDLDFMENHKEGILIEPSTYDALIKTISRDCLVLESFKIMDYSLLVGVHNMDIAGGSRRLDSLDDTDGEEGPSTSRETDNKGGNAKLSAWEIPDESGIPHGGVLARNSNGDRLILYLGVIDILQNYRLLKKMEHTWKAILHDGDSISVTNPEFYSKRFLNFMQQHLFKRGTADRKSNSKFRTLVHSYLALKTSPSRRRTRKSVGEEDVPVSARDVNPHIPPATSRAVTGRRSYRADTVSSDKEKKKTERLFAAPKSDDPLLPTEEEQIVSTTAPDAGQL